MNLMWILKRQKKAILNKKMFNIILNKTCFKIDLIPLKENNYEIEIFKNRIKMNFKNKEIFVISPENLIISKLLWSKSTGGSERQIKDCESIYRLNRETLNLNYIKKWVEILKLDNEFNKLV